MSDIYAALEEATITCGQMINDLDGSLEPGTEWSIEIMDVSEPAARPGGTG